jgi:hypothetical protein
MHIDVWISPVALWMGVPAFEAAMNASPAPVICHPSCPAKS